MTTNIEDLESRVSRRRFMRAAGIGVAGTALGAVTVSCAQKQKWDQEADVIVVGSGGAAFAAGIAAAENGASVIMLEKAAVAGGTTAKSGGGMWIPNNIHMQAAGLKDDRTTYLNYCARVSFPELYNNHSPTYGLPAMNFKLLETFYDNASAVHAKLVEIGAIKTHLAVSWEGTPTSDYQGQIPENGNIKGRQTEMEDFGGKRPRGLGADMIKFFQTYVEGKGGKVLVEHRVTKIIRDESGRVIGVAADTKDGPKTFHARKGVVFGSGGFTHNLEMRSNFLRVPVKGGCAVATNTGDLINMASELGVKFANLNEAWNQQLILEQILKTGGIGGLTLPGGDSTIIVNHFGKRTCDEKSVYPERSRSHAVYDAFWGNYPNLYQIWIFDEEARKFGGEGMPKPGANLPSHVIVGATLEELATKINERFASLAEQIGDYSLDADFLPTLKDTIKTYNGYAATGKDLDFRRGEAPADRFFHTIPYDRGLKNPYIAPISPTGPYYAILLAAGTLDTKGGPAFNEHAQVLNTRDEPIHGFYVAGNCSGSPSGKSYLGPGGTLGLGVTFGYIAGKHAAVGA